MSINQSHELYSGIAQLHQQLQRLQLRLRLRNVDIFHFAFKIIETFFHKTYPPAGHFSDENPNTWRRFPSVFRSWI